MALQGILPLAIPRRLPGACQAPDNSGSLFTARAQMHCEWTIWTDRQLGLRGGRVVGGLWVWKDGGMKAKASWGSDIESSERSRHLPPYWQNSTRRPRESPAGEEMLVTLKFCFLNLFSCKNMFESERVHSIYTQMLICYTDFHNVLALAILWLYFIMLVNHNWKREDVCVCVCVCARYRQRMCVLAFAREWKSERE